MAGTTLRLGRDPSCHIKVVDPTVSGRHADLMLTKAGELYVSDRGSTNGTAIIEDGVKRPISQDVVPRHARVAFGDCVFEAAKLTEILRMAASRAPEPRPEPRPGSPLSEFMRCPHCGTPVNPAPTCPSCKNPLPAFKGMS